MTDIKFGFLQTEPLFGQVERNVTRAVELLKNIRADLIVLPELFNTGYFFTSREELEELAEDVIEGYSVNTLRKLAVSRGFFIVAGIAEKAGENFFNSSVLIMPGGEIRVYRKAHLFYKEKLVFSKGDTPFSVYDTSIGTIGMMICFDWIYPEVCRTLALKGAVIICHPVNLVLPHCQGAMKIRALENRVFAVTSNRVGTETKDGETLRFTGQSQIVNPLGEVLAQAGPDREECIIVEADLKEASNKKITDYNDLFADRRPELYPLTENLNNENIT